MNNQKGNDMSEKTGLERLRVPFAPHQISKLPKPYKSDSPKGKCSECGGYHGLPAVHLDYVGHAALTDRLLEVDINWNWEPVAFGPDGYPVIDKNGGMWIRLTVCGVTRLGYGDAQGKTGANAMKECIGDALRNAAMRFGAALDLWHKGELNPVKDDEDDEEKLLPAEKFEDFKDRIKKQLTKEKAKYVWQEAAKACAAIGDKESSNMLKAVLLEHAAFIDRAAEREVAA